MKTMKQNKYDALVAKRRAKRKKNGKPVVVPKRRGYPLGVERAYQTELLKYFRKFNKIIKDIIIPEIKRLRESAQRELGLKFDAYDDEMKRVFETARIQVTENLPQADLERIIERKGLEVNAKNRELFSSQYQTITGVDPFASEPWLNAKVNAFTQENVRLIKKLEAETLGKIESSVYRGVSRGESLKSITNEVQKHINTDKSRAKLIARDQVSSLNSEITKIRQKDAGLGKYVWSTSLDERVRDSHASKEGQIFSWNDPPSDTGHPGQDINCRCVALPYFEDLEE